MKTFAHTRLAHWIAAAATLFVAQTVVAPASAATDEDPRQFIAFVEDFSGNCVARNGVQILVRSTHPSRKLRVWLDRFHMGVGTGDRSRSDLAPAADAEALGCSRTLNGAQEWRIVRAVWID